MSLQVNKNMRIFCRWIFCRFLQFFAVPMRNDSYLCENGRYRLYGWLYGYAKIPAKQDFIMFCQDLHNPFLEKCIILYM